MLTTRSNVDDEIFVHELLLYQLVIIVPFSEDIKLNLDYLLKELLTPNLKQFTHIALGFEDFNVYLNIMAEMKSYNDSFPLAYVKRTGEPKILELVGVNELCYLSSKLRENQSFYFLIVHFTFKEETGFHFESLIFKNSLQVKKKSFRFLTLCPFRESFKKVLTHYFSIPNVENVEFHTSSSAFLRTYEVDKRNFKFDISRDKKLFRAEFNLSQVKYFSHFTVERLK